MFIKAFFCCKIIITHTFKFNPLSNYTHMKMTYIFSLHQIWTESEKWAIASEIISWSRLSDITGLMADSVRMTSYDLWSREGLSVYQFLCLLTPGLSWNASTRSLWIYCYIVVLAHLLVIYFILFFSTCIPKYIFPPLPNTIWLSLPEYANIELAPLPTNTIYIYLISFFGRHLYTYTLICLPLAAAILKST